MPLHSDARAALKLAIQHTLDLASAQPPHALPTFVLTREQDAAGWHGEYVERPAFPPPSLDTMATDAQALRALRQHHPDHCEQVGTWSLGQMSVLGPQCVRSFAAALWVQHHDFAVSDAAIDDLLDELSRLIDDSTMELAFTAPLLNFAGPASVDEIVLAHGLKIVRLSDDEATELFGRPLPGAHGFGLQWPVEWAAKGRIREPKLLGAARTADPAPTALQDVLAGGVLALRTFQSGPVGHGTVWIRSAEYARVMDLHIGRSFHDSYVPPGSYNLARNQIQLLSDHATLMAVALDDSLGAACRRLADAEVRLQARDRILDAVIGMEAILLSTMDSEYHGEVRYRFSMNYAALHTETSERLAAFRLARDLYDLRSKIAHGTGLPERFRMGSESLLPQEAGARACEMLRAMIKRFLPGGRRPQYRDPEFWLGQALGSGE